MKQELWLVRFRTGREIKRWAFSEEEARILAQAEEINNGNDYRVSSVSRIQLPKIGVVFGS
jgi:hypothetical protein